MATSGDTNSSCDNIHGKHALCCRQIHMPLLTDMYQVTMAYAYWKNGMSDRYSVFDLFFRKNPFGGEFTVFAGLGECLNYLRGFSYCSDDIQFFRSILPATVEEEFYEYLSNINANDIVLYAVPEGSVVFPKEPLLRIEGPLIICQLLETTLLTLVNYSSLIATNAARYQIAIDNRPIQLYEFGLRRAQGPDGGLSASKYAYVGGFDGTSNLLAGRLYGIPVKGTHAHSFIMSHSTIDDLKSRNLKSKLTGDNVDFAQLCYDYKDELAKLLNVLSSESSTSEFIAFISYAIGFPESFMALVDTYDMIRKPKAASAASSNSSSFSCNSTEFDPNLFRLQSEECSAFDRNKLLSGILNFCAVALALNELGYRAIGIRIDSGDLAYQSIMAHESFCKVSHAYKIDWFKSLLIIASNDINEETIISLNEQKHKINAFGIGTHLVTCQRQPALGCVYKLVEVDKSPCIKISLDVEKVTIPSRKNVYRLFGQEGYALLDLMQSYEEDEPKVGEKVLCRHPFQESKRCFATPSRVEKLLQLWWSDGKIQQTLPSLEQIRDRVRLSLSQLRPDIRRLLNATPYKVSVTNDLYQFMHRLWLENAPVGELH